MKTGMLSLALVLAAGQAEAGTFPFNLHGVDVAHASLIKVQTSTNNQTIGAIAAGTNGSFRAYMISNGTWVPKQLIPGGNAVGLQGVSGVFNHNDNGVYVFETEAGGMWFNRSTDLGSSWQGWCLIASGNDFISAPSAVYLDYGGGFTVFVRSSIGSPYGELRSFSTTATSPTCSTTWQERALGPITGAPEAVSWGPRRFDVFGRSPAGRLAHWYSSDGTNVGFEDSFSIQGTRTVLPVASGAEAISVASIGLDDIDVVVRSTTRVKHMRYLNAWRPILDVGAAPNALVAAGTLFSPAYGDVGLAVDCQPANCVAVHDDTPDYNAIMSNVSSNMIEVRSGVMGTNDSFVLGVDASGSLWITNGFQ